MVKASDALWPKKPFPMSYRWERLFDYLFSYFPAPDNNMKTMVAASDANVQSP